MELVNTQVYMHILSKLNHLSTRFVALEKENHIMFGDLQELSAKKAQYNVASYQNAHSNFTQFYYVCVNKIHIFKALPRKQRST